MSHLQSISGLQSRIRLCRPPVVLEPSTTEERLGCLGAILGVLVGGWVGLQHFAAHAQQQLAETPDALVCGTPALAVMGLGAFCGLFAGAIIGMLLGRVLR